MVVEVVNARAIISWVERSVSNARAIIIRVERSVSVFFEGTPSDLY